LYKKNGKFFADWRDHTGHRHRKSFTTARAAQKYEDRMRPKKAAARQSRKS